MKKIFTLSIFSLAFNYASAQGCIENTNSVTFDGFAAYASPANQTNLDIVDSLTIEAWINPSSFGFNSFNNSIVCKSGWSNGEGGFVLRCGGAGELSFNIAGLDVNQNPTSWNEVLSPTNALTLNTWTHVAGSYDGQNLRLFINGVEQNSIAFQGSIVASPNYPLTLGKLSDPGQPAQRFFDGLIDEVRIWHRAVPAAELMANMNKHIDPVTAVDLISYWRFNEGTGTNSVDLKSGYDITLNGNNWDTLVPFNITYPIIPTITYNNGILNASANGQWSLNGTPVAGATSIFYMPLVNGDYTFTTVANSAGCVSTSTPITISDVSIQDLTNEITVNVYPNPMIDQAVISINATKNYNAVSFEIIDLAGRQVYAEPNLTIKNGINQISINKNMLTQGVYFYQFTKANKSLSKGKLMVK